MALILATPAFDPLMAEARPPSGHRIRAPHASRGRAGSRHTSGSCRLSSRHDAGPAINMVLRGVPARFPNLKIILSHGGGFLPYAAYRVANLANVHQSSGEL